MGRKSIALWLASAVVVAAALGCSGGKQGAGAGGKTTAGGKRFIILSNKNSTFYDAMAVGMKDAGEKLGVVAVLEANDGTQEGQLNKLRQFGTQSDIAGVAVSAIDASNPAIADQMRKLREKGIQVITVDSDIDRAKFRDARVAFVGTDNRAGGRELGIAAKNVQPAGASFVHFVGRTGAQNAMERMEGFAEGAGAKFKELDRMADDLDRVRAKENVRNALSNHPRLNMLVGIWSYNAPAIADVVREMNKRDAVKVVVFDADPTAIKRMGEGLIDVMIVQNPYQMGYQGVRLMKALADKDDKVVKELLPNLGQKDGDLVDTGLKVLVPDEGTPLKPEMFGRTTEFYTLSKFREWLAKYNLQGS